MRIFKCSIGMSLAIKLMRNFYALKLLLYTFWFLEIWNWLDSSFLFIFFNNHFSFEGLILFYVISTIIYLRLTNHNFIFGKDKLKIEPSLLKWNSVKEFRYDYIKEVIIKHESQLFERNWYLIPLDFIVFIFFPFEYKWVEIKTKSNTTYKTLCFGFEFDYYDNCDSEQLMEDIFLAFVGKGVKVEWTKSSDSYFNDMNKEAKRRLSFG